MNRTDAFHSLATHPWLKKCHAKLTDDEKRLATDFITANDSLNKSQFEMAVNRMFIDQKNKPKRYAIILELLSCANGRVG